MKWAARKIREADGICLLIWYSFLLAAIFILGSGTPFLNLFNTIQRTWKN